MTRKSLMRTMHMRHLLAVGERTRWNLEGCQFTVVTRGDQPTETHKIRQRLHDVIREIPEDELFDVSGRCAGGMLTIIADYHGFVTEADPVWVARFRDMWVLHPSLEWSVEADARIALASGLVALMG